MKKKFTAISACAGLLLVCLCAALFSGREAQAKTLRVSSGNAAQLRSSLQKLNNQGGGTLIVNKGTYKLSNTLFVSSNIHIVLKNGVVLKKTKSGQANSTMFQFIRQSRASKNAVIGKHGGEKNISIKGKGKAVIDLAYVKMGSQPVIGIVMGHNKNIKIENITFKNMRYGHIIEMDACKNVSIKNCTFTGHRSSGKYNKEAINLDTPDKKRQGFNASWSKKDGTPNEDISITNCRFNKLETAIGTHRYTGNSYHTNVTIKNCSFDKDEMTIRVLNWKNATITRNTFTNIDPNSRYPYCFFIAGARGINFSHNSFKNCGSGSEYLLEFWCNRGYAAGQTIYPATTSQITEKEAGLFLTNTAKNCGSIHLLDCPYNVDFSEYAAGDGASDGDSADGEDYEEGYNPDKLRLLTFAEPRSLSYR